MADDERDLKHESERRHNEVEVDTEEETDEVSGPEGTSVFFPVTHPYLGVCVLHYRPQSGKVFQYVGRESVGPRSKIIGR